MLLLLLLLLPGVHSGPFQPAALQLRKCCAEHERLDGTGRRCVAVSADARNVSISYGRYDRIIPPYDPRWLRRWLPPGLPTSRIQFVSVRNRHYRGQSVLLRPNESFSWDGRSVEVLRRPRTASFYYSNVVRLTRRHDDTTTLFAFYCVDEAEAPLAPHVVAFGTVGSSSDLMRKCCPEGQLLVDGRESTVACRGHPRGYWSPYNSSLTAILHPETEYKQLFPKLPLYEWLPTPSPQRFAELLFLKTYKTFFSVSDTCGDFKLEADGSVRDALAYIFHSRYTRGTYWLARNLSFASIALLVAALAAIASKQRMRKSAHGWALSCHALCLLLFNVGQVSYYLSVSDEIDSYMYYVPERLENLCLGFSFTLYFLLVAASTWLTAVCLNMTAGFRARGGSPGGAAAARSRERRRFAWLSAFAWGLATLLTGACAAAFLLQSERSRRGGRYSGWREPVVSYQGPWHRPSFVETRTCFNELVTCDTKGRRLVTMLTCGLSIQKGGSLLFYYAPACALAAANAAALALTARRVHALRSGHSVLRRDREQQEKQQQRKKRAAADSQSSTVYLKLLLSAGLLEVGVELGAWATTSVVVSGPHAGTDAAIVDHTLALRSAGYFADLFRAACVLWLAAPDLPRALARGLRCCRRPAQKSPGPAATATTALPSL